MSARSMLAGAFAIGLALRIAHLVALRRSPFFTSLVLDARYYDAWAREIAAGAWIGRAAFWVDPLYAYLLGLAYRIGGHNLLLPRLIAVACGLLTGCAAARIARRVWQSSAAAAIAALLSMAFVPTLYFEGQTEKTALTVLLVTAAVELFLRGTAGALLAAGVVSGLAVLARGNALLLAPAAALCLAFGWEREHDGARKEPLRQRMRRAATFIAGLVPMLALAALHNWLAVGQFVPTTTNLGVNLFLGNHAGNTYGYYTAPAFLHPDTGAELPDFRAEAQRRTGRVLTDQELSAYWRRQAWDAVRAEPGLAVARTLHKLHLALHNSEEPDNEDVTMVAEWSPVLRSPVVWFGQLLPLAVLGAVIGWRRRGIRILTVTAVTYLLSLLPFFIMARLRVQIVPLLCVLAAGAILWLAAAIGRRRLRSLLAAAALLAPVVFIAHHRTDWMAHHHRSSLAIAWNNLGSSLVKAGQADDAIRAYERAVAIDAEAVPASLRALGSLYRARGEMARAEAAMRRVVEIRPHSPSAREALRRLYEETLRDPRWRDDRALRARAQLFLGALGAAAPSGPAQAVITQARSLANQGRSDEAIRVLQEAVRMGPYDESLHYALGETMERHGSPDDMIRFFSQEVIRDQKPQTSHYFLAVGLARRGDVNAAIAELRTALDIDPAHEMSQRQWGLLLERQGRHAEALEHYLEATRIHPGFRAAWMDAARVAAALGRSRDADAYSRQAASADPNTVRRYLYWARYLHQHGRHQAAWVELQRMLRERPADAEALALGEQIRAALPEGAIPALRTDIGDTAPGAGGAAAGGHLSAEARAAFIARLAGQAPAAAWIAYDARDPAAQRLAAALSTAFKEARWSVRSLAPVTFAIRAGLFVFVAEDPSDTTRAVSEALDVAGLNHTLGTRYREYSAGRRRSDPRWQGVEFAPEQEFVIVVGRPAAG